MHNGLSIHSASTKLVEAQEVPRHSGPPHLRLRSAAVLVAGGLPLVRCGRRRRRRLLWRLLLLLAGAPVGLPLVACKGEEANSEVRDPEVRWHDVYDVGRGSLMVL